jgi:Mlc titration factor MtfA (ptsG expression regulator)
MSAHTTIIYVFIFIILTFIVEEQIRTRLNRKKLKARPFPPEWERIIHRNVFIYRYIPDTLKKQLQENIKLFMSKKLFEGLDGLNMTDEIRVTIASQACILLLNQKDRIFPGLTSILVYPGAYVAPQHTSAGFVHIEEKSVRLGESWQKGAVVLAWDHVKQQASDVQSGHNVVLHEFAHQLDQEDGRADGAPILENSSGYVAWARILGNEYIQLQRNVRRGKRSVMDDYGASNPAEFFAVATETFFVKPKQLKYLKPDLYRELKEYYQVDPAEWYSITSEHTPSI